MTRTQVKQRFVEEHALDVDRFSTFVDSSGGQDSCWPWSGARDESGYGRFHVGRSRNSTMLAHRIAFGLENGVLPEAVCHRCDNPCCCNPRHLFGGTRGDNNRDMRAKGRHRVNHLVHRGESSPRAKLSNEDARAIRAAYARGLVSQRALARQFGVSQRTINKVVRHIGFKNVT